MKWFKSEKDKQKLDKVKTTATKTVFCPHCDFEQSVSTKVELAFCKNCNKIINTKQLGNQPKKVKPAVIPTTSTPQSKPDKTESTKPALKPVSSELKEQKPISVIPSFEEEKTQKPLAGTELKQVICSHCKTEQKVPAIALSSFCKKCGQRINLQDYEIKGKFQGELETRGVICVANGADVTAEINVGMAVVEGKVRGNIVAESKVELKSTGIVFGTITSPILLVDDGAIFVGKAIIKPKKS